MHVIGRPSLSRWVIHLSNRIMASMWWIIYYLIIRLMIHRLMFKPCLSDKYSQSCTNLKYPHFNTERMRRSSMVVGRILYLFNWRYLRYCTRSSNASWTTLSSNLVSIDRLVIELWSKATGHTVAEGAMVHGVELCVSRRCEVLRVVCLPKKCRCGSAKKSDWGGKPTISA